jgi:vesicle coat complex subunit
MVNDETFPPIIMHIITNIIPTQHKSNELRKVMLLYWEIIEKSKSPTDKSLKE